MARPNILLLTWHDAGRWFGCYGNRHVRTPHVDRLAREGACFRNTFSACAICSPSRAAIATGRTCQANGVIFLTNTVNNNRLHRSERHLCRRLKEDHGYRTALFGVQHECAHEHVTEVLAPHSRHAVDPWPQAPTISDAFEQWLPQQGSEPFYAQIGFHEAHLGSLFEGNEKPAYPHAWDDSLGLEAPPYLADTPLGRRAIGTLQGYLKRADEALGRILRALERAGRLDDTLVCMCVDHGVGLPRAKTTCYDPGTAVAWLLRWPANIPAGTEIYALTTHIDVLPTLFGLLGFDIPENVHGRDLSAHARGESTAELNDCVFSHMVETRRAVRTHTHKLIRNFRPDCQVSQGPVPADLNFRGAVPKPPLCASPHLELYDLQADPHEFHNLAGNPAHTAIQAELDARLWDFLLNHGDFLPNEPVRTAFQAETRRHLEAHCLRAGRTAPTLDCDAC